MLDKLCLVTVVPWRQTGRLRSRPSTHWLHDKEHFLLKPPRSHPYTGTRTWDKMHQAEKALHSMDASQVLRACLPSSKALVPTQPWGAGAPTSIGR